MKRSRSL